MSRSRAAPFPPARKCLQIPELCVNGLILFSSVGFVKQRINGVSAASSALLVKEKIEEDQNLLRSQLVI